MKLAFVLFKYFPYGGLQWKCVRIASVLQSRGHEINVFTMSWEGELPAGFNINIIPVNERQNHKRYEAFHHLIEPILNSGQFDAVVGFNKMPGLDVYYAADPCYQQKPETLRPWYYKYTSRYRFFSRFEQAVFNEKTKTELMMISTVEMGYFIKHYNTPEQQFHVLPPGINKNRIRPDNAKQIREDFREAFKFSDNDLVCLMIGSDFKRKGVDRTLRAIASLPDELRFRTTLIVIGQDKAKPMEKLAKQLGIENQLEIYSGRDDVPRFLLGADLFCHPAYSEAAGNVIIEAIISGLPVLITDVCGYSHHVTQSQAGMLVPSPFDQTEFNVLFHNMLTSSQRTTWQKNGERYGKTEDLYSLQDVAADIIEEKARSKAQ
ncbi:MAG: glycosyltransferase family 4 protein [Methylococcales bacterium]|nr:glycosyltransferase family 4 protein [Methylococcales bacterium]